jgi:hypothetical protein
MSKGTISKKKFRLLRKKEKGEEEDFIVRLDLSRDVSVHVETRTSHDFNVLTPVMRKLWR